MANRVVVIIIKQRISGRFLGLFLSIRFLRFLIPSWSFQTRIKLLFTILSCPYIWQHPPPVVQPCYGPFISLVFPTFTSQIFKFFTKCFLWLSICLLNTDSKVISWRCNHLKQFKMVNVEAPYFWFTKKRSKCWPWDFFWVCIPLTRGVFWVCIPLYRGVFRVCIPLSRGVFRVCIPLFGGVIWGCIPFC